MLNIEERDQLSIDFLTEAAYHREWLHYEEKCGYFAPVRRLSTQKIAEPIQEVGMFGNQNTVWTDAHDIQMALTVDGLKTYFVEWNTPCFTVK